MTPLVQGGHGALGGLGRLSTLKLAREPNSAPLAPVGWVLGLSPGQNKEGIWDRAKKGLFTGSTCHFFGEVA